MLHIIKIAGDNMPTCPDCGSLIMEGDPYCSHCGAHLSWSEEIDSRPPSPLMHDEEDDFEKHYARIQNSLKKISEYYNVELEDLDLKDGYTDYIFTRHTPFYDLRMVATDQAGGVVGIRNSETQVDYSKLKANRDFNNLTKDLDIQNISMELNTGKIILKTNNGDYLLDTDSMKLISND